jgi:1-acyl-sn-glycerol-3-phosphate acyltransferase
LLPLRLAFLFFGMIGFSIIFFLAHWFNRADIKALLFKLGCKMWLFTFGAIVRHHGVKKREREPHIYVGNHTSFTDFFLLSSHEFPHAILSQVHGGLFGIFQHYLLALIGSLEFNRDEQRDRILISERMKLHASSSDNLPLLVFPEGTCVNNEATVLFHKGAFELGAAVVPVAIKYNKRLLDPYWNTREQSFSQHVFYLMTRWFMIADVWWLPLQKQREGESTIEFTNRVKAMISEAAGLMNLSWDGYMKNFMKNTFRDKLLLSTQQQYADNLKSEISPHLLEKSPLLPPVLETSSSSIQETSGRYKKQRSLSAFTIEEFGRRSASPLHMFPEWLSEHSLVDIKNSLMSRRFLKDLKRASDDNAISYRSGSQTDLSEGQGGTSAHAPSPKNKDD